MKLHKTLLFTLALVTSTVTLTGCKTTLSSASLGVSYVSPPTVIAVPRVISIRPDYLLKRPERIMPRSPYTQYIQVLPGSVYNGAITK